jgi:electron transfer flavoprotein alpha subunit
MYPEIDKTCCINCKVRIDICPYEVFGEVKSEAAVVSPEDCIECGECVRNCESNAINLKDG